MAARNSVRKYSKTAVTVAASHPDVWDTVEFVREFYALTVGEMFTAPDKTPGRFKLIPFDEPDIYGEVTKRLRVELDGSSMLPHWANTIFDTCGTDPPKLDQVLPKWVDDMPTRRRYINILRKLSDRLKKAECNLERIEGNYERLVKYDNDVSRRVYTVRGVHLPNAVEDGMGGTSDVLFFVANDPEGGPAPDGGATGPPKPP